MFIKLKTIDKDSLAQNKVEVNEYIRDIFDEFKYKYYEYIVAENIKLMDNINSKISTLTTLIGTGSQYLETNQNYNNLINRSYKKLITNGASKERVDFMAAKAKTRGLSVSNKKQILKLLKTTNNTSGVIKVSTKIKEMLESKKWEEDGDPQTQQVPETNLSAQGAANSGGNANSNGVANSKNKWGRSPAQVARNVAGAAAMETAMNNKGFLSGEDAAAVRSSAATAEKNAGNQQREPKRQRTDK